MDKSLLSPQPNISEERKQLSALVGHRNQLNAMLQAEKNRLRAQTGAIRNSLETLIACLAAELGSAKVYDRAARWTGGLLMFGNMISCLGDLRSYSGGVSPNGVLREDPHRAVDYRSNTYSWAAELA